MTHLDISKGINNFETKKFPGKLHYWTVVIRFERHCMKNVFK